MSDCSLAIAQGGNKNSLGKFIIFRKMIQHTQGLIYNQSGALQIPDSGVADPSSLVSHAIKTQLIGKKALFVLCCAFMAFTLRCVAMA